VGRKRHVLAALPSERAPVTIIDVAGWAPWVIRTGVKNAQSLSPTWEFVTYDN